MREPQSPRGLQRPHRLPRYRHWHRRPVCPGRRVSEPSCVFPRGITQMVLSLPSSRRPSGHGAREGPPWRGRLGWVLSVQRNRPRGPLHSALRCWPREPLAGGARPWSRLRNVRVRQARAVASWGLHADGGQTTRGMRRVARPHGAPERPSPTHARRGRAPHTERHQDRGPHRAPA